MKVFALPAEIPAPAVNYQQYDRDQVAADERAHQERLAAWLRTNGYPGPHTGKVYRTHVADGYALYMLADGKTSALIHLPYGDAYESRDVGFLPKKEILARIAADERRAAFFRDKT
jgi:hypothetical protein